ncbi:MAG: alkaline phosphatase family protein [Rhodoluna sp.]
MASALGAVTGTNNRLGFKRASKVCVILVDGLGAENIRQAAGHAPYLSTALRASKSINTVFPTTTAAAITSFGVGTTPSKHGVFGYSVYERTSGTVRNLLSGWGPDFVPGDFQKLPSLVAAARNAGVDFFSVGPGEYADSGFTHLNLSGSTYRPAKTFDERVRETKAILARKSKSLTYLYFPELDATAHAFGVTSAQWLNKLEDLDAVIRQLTKDLPADTGVVLTADHGVVDVAPQNQILLDELAIEGLISVTGDPRNTFLYFAEDVEVSHVKSELSQKLAGTVHVADVKDLVAAGWFEAHIVNAGYLPDLFLISQDGYACYHRGFAKPQSLKMIGQHGGFTTTELSVPLLKYGVFGD